MDWVCCLDYILCLLLIKLGVVLAGFPSAAVCMGWVFILGYILGLLLIGFGVDNCS